VRPAFRLLSPVPRRKAIAARAFSSQPEPADDSEKAAIEDHELSKALTFPFYIRWS